MHEVLFSLGLIILVGILFRRIRPGGTEPDAKAKHGSAIIPAVVIKLVAGPLIAYATTRMLGLTGIALISCSIEGAMPAMALSILVAARFNLDVSLAAFMIVATTVLSFFTLPAVIYFGTHIP